MLLFWDCFAVTKPLSQIQGSTLWPLQAPDTTPSFGGFRLKQPGLYRDLGRRLHLWGLFNGLFGIRESAVDIANLSPVQIPFDVVTGTRQSPVSSRLSNIGSVSF